MSKAVAILPDGADPDAVARVDADQRVVDEVDALAHRHAQMVHEFQRRRAGAAFIAVDHDEVGIDAGLQHRLADRQELPGMADAQLEAGGLAAGQPPHLGDEGHHLQRRRERPVRRPARCSPRPCATPRILEISSETLAAGSTPPCPGLAPWLILSSTILIWSSAGDAREFLRIEGAVAVAAAEIAGADFPDDVAAVLAMIGADAALAGVMRKAAFLGAGVQRAHRVRAERAKTHRRDVEDRRRIRPGAIRAADGDAEFLVACGFGATEWCIHS